MRRIITKLKSCDSDDILAFLFCLSFFFGWFALLCYKFFHFGYKDWDLTLYAQALFRLGQGSLTSSLFGTTFLANHSHYVAFLVLPFYKILPHPLTLIALKLLSFFAGAFVFYLIAKRLIAPRIAIVVMLFYIIFPPNVFMLNFEFHFESLAIIFIFLMFYSYQRRIKPLFLISGIILLLIKENIPFVVSFVGLMILLSKEKEKLFWGWIPFLVGGIFGFLNLFVMMPAIRSSMPVTENIYLQYYNDVLPQEAQGAVAATQQVVLGLKRQLFNGQNFAYLQSFMNPLLWLPVLSPGTLIPLIPLLVQNFLSKSWTQQSIYFHYSATLLPFIFIAFVRSLKKLKSRVGMRTVDIIVFILTFVICVNVWLCLRPLWKDMRQWKDPLDYARYDLVKSIPKEAGVVTTFRFLAWLSNREALYAFYNVTRDQNFFTGEKKYIVPKEVEFALVDGRDEFLVIDYIYNPEKTLAQMQKFLSPEWRVQAAVDETILFKKNLKGAPLLVEKSRQPFEIKGASSIMTPVTQQVTLEAVKFGQLVRKDQYSVLPIDFMWKSLDDVKDDMAVLVVVTKNDEAIRATLKDIGYFLHPTSSWLKGDFIREKFWLGLPKLFPGKYSVEIVLLSSKDKRGLLFFDRKLNQVTLYRRVVLGEFEVLF